MANKPSQAEKRAASAKKTTAPAPAAKSSGRTGKDTSQKSSSQKTVQKDVKKTASAPRPTKPAAPPEPKPMLPAGLLWAFGSAVFFFLLVTVCLSPNGVLQMILKSMLQGLVGKVGFFLMIPGSVMLFCINAFSRGKPTGGRNACVFGFVTLCGTIQHLLSNVYVQAGPEVVADLYRGGSEGTTGGVLSGLLGMLLKWLCGTGVGVVICLLAGVLLVMGAFGITIPGILRAVNELPKEDWEDERPRVEPSKAMVDHIVTKKKEYKERAMLRDADREVQRVTQSFRMEQLNKVSQPVRPQAPQWEAPRQEQQVPQPEPQMSVPRARAHIFDEPPVVRQEAPKPEPVKQEAAPEIPKQEPVRGRFQDMMNVIDLDIDAPVAASARAVAAEPEIPTDTPIFAPDDWEKETEPYTDYDAPVMDAPYEPVADTYEPEEQPAVEPEPVPVEPQRSRVIPVRVMPAAKPAVRQEPVPAEPEPEPQRAPVPLEAPVRQEASEEPQQPKQVTAKQAQAAARVVEQEITAAAAEPPKPEYVFPPVDLLKGSSAAAVDGSEEMRENARRLNETLASFHIDAHIANVTRGPSVTRYEVELDKGVRLNKLTGCAEDIALNLGASGVRIAAVPGKISIVGIEVPNRSVTMVPLREVIDSPEFARAKGKSSFSVGKDIGGSCIVGNIAKMPHMLIAGTTGSGKSVCMNSIIISLLYKAKPEEVKLIMVDPKMVELGIYNGIPHLLIPVVTDPKKAAGSLQWAVTEMLRRYKLMSDAGVRDLESYNSIAKADGQQPLPQCVIIIDELADLMLVAAKEVEDSICRIAQMGRASGMHLIIATQRPSADVITGLMKANIPSRIAFSVASAMESRIILDTQGAEKLVGKGDMLYAPIGCGKPLRVQGCFVSDGEVERVASFVKEHSVADYSQDVLEDIEKKAQQAGKGGKAATAAPEPEIDDDDTGGDPMLPAAVEVILDTKQASVSMLQRRLKLGYARAARIVDEMEEKGYVGPFQGSKPREILITKEKWAQMQGTAELTE